MKSGPLILGLHFTETGSSVNDPKFGSVTPRSRSGDTIWDVRRWGVGVMGTESVCERIRK